jgi:hypothetical protein
MTEIDCKKEGYLPMTETEFLEALAADGGAGGAGGS